MTKDINLININSDHKDTNKTTHILTTNVLEYQYDISN